jgi:histidinol phosphatase-like enzyme
LCAACEHGLDLSESWMVGDMVSDVLAGINAGCRGSFLVTTGKHEPLSGNAAAAEMMQVPDMTAVVDFILQNSAIETD